jgi:16S rRNA (adenine1518-N6/adenine1519-N6)-dimethyltransferase
VAPSAGAGRGRARRTRPALGQHFLVDEHILHRLVTALEPNPPDVVLEIGPGTGTLTRLLAPRVSRVLAIEKDRRLAIECGMRNAECGIANVEIVRADALRVDWHALIPHSALGPAHFKIVGNIPYYITSPLVDKALTPPLPALVVFLVQAEVARRMAAPPGSRTYGALSVGVQSVSRVEHLFRVKAGAFRPPPAVDSAAIRLTPRSDVTWESGELERFRRFVGACFGRRRKQLHNVLRGVTGWSAGAVATLCDALGLDPTTRPERLDPETFQRIWRETLRGTGGL